MQRLVPAETYANVLDVRISAALMPRRSAVGAGEHGGWPRRVRRTVPADPLPRPHRAGRGGNRSPRTIWTGGVAPNAAPPGRVDGAGPRTVTGGDSVDLGQALGMLRSEGHQIVLCEDGPHLLGELVAGDLLDELCLTLSPTMGGDPLPISVTPAGSPLRPFDLAHVAESDGHLFLHYERTTHGS